MVSNNKLMRYYVSGDESSSVEDSYEVMDYQSKKGDAFFEITQRTSGKPPRSTTRNALMARENRLKKKRYLKKLENKITVLKKDNKDLSSAVRSQTILAMEMMKENKYLKSVIANSGDIKNLIRNIHNTTGMPVSSSLDKNMSLETANVPNIPLTEEENDCNGEFSNLGLVFDDNSIDWHGNIPDSPLNTPDPNIFETEPSSSLEEHDYTAQADDYDVGVCLHVSKHRVSLEFCSVCNEKAEESFSQL